MNRGGYPTTPTAAHFGPEQSGPSFEDNKLELMIEGTRLAMLGAVTKSIRQELFEEMRRLIGRRSPWMIAHLEKEKGLR